MKKEKAIGDYWQLSNWLVKFDGNGTELKLGHSIVCGGKKDYEAESNRK